MPDLNCRVAKAEQKLEIICEQFQRHSDEEHDQLLEIREMVATVQKQLASQRSFIQGISFTLSALAAVVGTAWHYFTNGN